MLLLDVVAAVVLAEPVAQNASVVPILSSSTLGPHVDNLTLDETLDTDSAAGGLPVQVEKPRGGCWAGTHSVEASRTTPASRLRSFIVSYPRIVRATRLGELPCLFDRHFIGAAEWCGRPW